jgi:spermidine/putrescine transport system permease protein
VAKDKSKPTDIVGRNGIIDWSRLFIGMPTLFWFVCLIVIPLIVTLAMSFASRDAYGRIIYEWSFDNYIRFVDPLYLEILWRSFYLGLITVLICIVIGYPLAYFIARSPKRYKPLYLMMVIAPFWINLLIRAYGWMILLRYEGIINLFLRRIGLIEEPLQLMYNDGAVLVGLVYVFLQFMVLPLYATIDKLDWTLLESAQDLGAGSFQTFRHITLPLTFPGIVGGSILTFVPAFGSFIIPRMLGGSRSIMIGNIIETQIKVARNWPFASASAVILIAAAFLGMLIYIKFSGRTLMGGE